METRLAGRKRRAEVAEQHELGGASMVVKSVRLDMTGKMVATYGSAAAAHEAPSIKLARWKQGFRARIATALDRAERAAECASVARRNLETYGAELVDYTDVYESVALSQQQALAEQLEEVFEYESETESASASALSAVEHASVGKRAMFRIAHERLGHLHRVSDDAADAAALALEMEQDVVQWYKEFVERK